MPDEIPVIDLKNVISILISSDFLQMQELVNECISYVVSNLHDVVRLPIDMSCLNDSLIRQISDKVPMEKLDKLPDKRDKLTSKIFQKKTEKFAYLLSKEEIKGQYTKAIHGSLWQPKLYLALKKAIDEGSGDVNVFDNQFNEPFSDCSPEYIKIFEIKEFDDSHAIQCCNNCSKLFTEFENLTSACQEAKINIDCHGKIVS